MPSSISADEENELAKKTKTGLRDAIVFCLYFDTLAVFGFVPQFYSGIYPCLLSHLFINIGVRGKSCRYCELI